MARRISIKSKPVPVTSDKQPAQRRVCVFDYIIAGELHMSDQRLREINQTALDTLAGMLQLTVFDEDAVPAISVI